MPYANDGHDVPGYVTGGDKKRRQWSHVWNSAYQRALNDGKSHADAEAFAFAEANAVAGPSSKSIASNVSEQIGFKKFYPVTKVDEQTHTVYGLATSEAVDCDNEIADYDGAKQSFQKWSSDAIARTSGTGASISLGNVRVQHSAGAVGGVVTRIDYKDTEKQIWTEATPATDEVWEMIKMGALAGFSIGGKVTKTKKEGEYTRYWFTLVELSLVDSPANPEATFAYIKADGSVELRKFRRSPNAVIDDAAKTAQQTAKQFASLTNSDTWEGATTYNMEQTPTNPLFSPEQLAQISAIVNKDGKTKRVAGEDLPASAFAYVGDKDRTETWKLPLHFSSEEKSRRHTRNALARFSHTDLPADAKSRVYAKIVAAAKKYGIEVSSEEKKAASLLEFVKASLQKAATGVNLKKGADMFQISGLAAILQDLAFLYHVNADEAVWEEDDRDDAIAVEMRAAIEHLVSILKDIVDDETSELLPALKAAQSELEILKGESFMDNDLITEIAKEIADLTKGGHTLKSFFHKMAAHHDKKAAHHEKMASHHEACSKSHDGMCDVHNKCMGKADDGDGMDMKAFHKAAHAHHKEMAAHHGHLHKAHMKAHDHHKMACETCKSYGDNYEGGIPESAVDGKAAAAKAAADKAAAEKAALDKAVADALKASVTGLSGVTTTTATAPDLGAVLVQMQKSFDANTAVLTELQKSVGALAAAPANPGTTVTKTAGVEVPRGPSFNFGKAATADVGI